MVAKSVTKPTAADARAQFRESIDMRGTSSAADLLLALLGVAPRYVDGPSERVATTVTKPIDRVRFDHAGGEKAPEWHWRVLGS